MRPPIRTLTLDELAAEAAAPTALLERLVQLGQLRSDGEGRFDARDVAIIATVQALEGAGVSDDDLVWLIQNAGGGYQAVGRMFTTPAPRGAPTYRDFLDSLGPLGPRVSAIYAGFGLPEPEPERPMRDDEASIMRRFLLAWDAVDEDGDSAVRVARLTGEASRRVMEGWLDAWDAVARPELTTQGAPGAGGRPADPADPDQNPSVSGAALVREMLAWLNERHLERTLNQRIIDATEGALVGAGRLPARPSLPTAVAFVDLTGYTSLTERLGDDAAAAAAVRLAVLADDCVRNNGGRVVKLLGDGVLLRFDDPRTAVDAVLELLDAIEAAGLPSGHAGIAAGRVVQRDGDIYGRTVNLAARVSAHAESGRLLVDEEVAGILGDRAGVEPAGSVALAGFAEPVALWSVRPLDPQPS
ncbi:MAG: adenylate/guanylate cyclase domain-containing protein [Chloroflexota bacterium]